MKKVTRIYIIEGDDAWVDMVVERSLKAGITTLCPGRTITVVDQELIQQLTENMDFPQNKLWVRDDQ